MSQKKVKSVVRLVRKNEQEIKIEGLKEFVRFYKNQPIFKRITFALKIIFKRVNV